MSRRVGPSKSRAAAGKARRCVCPPSSLVRRGARRSRRTAKRRKAGERGAVARKCSISGRAGRSSGGGKASEPSEETRPPARSEPLRDVDFSAGSPTKPSSNLYGWAWCNVGNEGLAPFPYGTSTLKGVIGSVTWRDSRTSRGIYQLISSDDALRLKRCWSEWLKLLRTISSF